MEEIDRALDAAEQARTAANVEDAFEYRWERVAAMMEAAISVIRTAQREARAIERSRDA